jgi:hypothetical protein
MPSTHADQTGHSFDRLAGTDGHSTGERSQRLVALQAGATLEEALALFDECPPVPLAAMAGSWRGVGVPTGNPFDGLLEAFGWRGKWFLGPDNVHPLVFETRGGSVFSVNPALMPMGLAARAGRLVRSRPGQILGRAVIGLARTRRPAARLRMMAYRGVVTATMSYDALPINDHFRRIAEDTVIGIMDFRQVPQPFVFALRRTRVP